MEEGETHEDRDRQPQKVVSNSQPLFAAALENDTKKIQKLLHDGHDPNSRDADTGRTPLHMSAILGNVSAVQLLIHGNACPNIADKRGNHVIHTSISNKDLVISHILLENGANVNAENEKKITPLFLAIACDSVEVVDFVLNKGGKMNTTNKDGKTPMMIAAINGNTDIVHRLMEEDVDLSVKDQKNKDVLHYAATGGNADIFKLLVDSMLRQDLVTGDYSDTLMIASQRGYAKIVGMLLKSTSCDINMTNGMRQSPLHLAVQGKYKQTTKVLIQYDATVDRRDHGILGSNTALVYAGKKNMCSILRILLNAGAELERVNIEQKTALFYTAENGHKPAVATILEFYKEQWQSNLTITGDEVMYYQSPLNVIQPSPLEAAVIGGHAKVVEILLNDGMVRRLKSALACSARKGDAKVFKCIVSHVSKESPRTAMLSHFPTMINWQRSLVLAVTNGHLNIVKYFVRRGFSEWLGYDFARQPIQQSKTALHLAAGGGYLKIVKLLLRNGADIEALDEFSNSPFLYAVEMNRTPVVSYFLTGRLRGRKIRDWIDVNRRNSMAVHLASMNGNAQMLHYLIVAGCDMNVPCNWPVSAGSTGSTQYGFYPIILAVMNKNFPMAVVLLNGSCSLNCYSMINMTNHTPLTCTIKGDDTAVFRLLQLSGGLSHSSVIRQCKSIIAADNFLPKTTKDWVRAAISTPLKLQDICRFVIRSRITGVKVMKVKCLGLPKATQSFVLMEEFL